MNEKIQKEITDRLQEIAVKINPNITFRSMYGGIVFELKKDDPKSRIGGVFIYSEYVSLELSKGVSLKDPNRVLEGVGKSRRHAKIYKWEDVLDKNCSDFLRQAILLK